MLKVFLSSHFRNCFSEHVAGLEVFDASLERNVLSKAYLLYCTADIRAFPHLNSQMSAPAICGACDQCHQEGTRLPPDNRTVYLGYHRFLLSLFSCIYVIV